MKEQEFLKCSGLDRVPVYWDRRYTKNIEQMSKPVYTVALEEDVEIILRDGCKIYADVYHPAEIQKAPSLIAWSAYGKHMQNMKHGSLPGASNYFDHSLEAGDIDFFVQRGYTFIIPDPRGIGESEGEFLGIYNPQEHEDVYDTIEWAGTECPWSTEKVALLGYSYFGIIQALAAALQPPHLVCIMPLSYTDDYYQHGYYGGVPDTYMNMYWELCPANNPVPWTTKMMSEEEMRARIKEIAKDPDIGNNTYFDKMFHVWPPKYHTFYLDYLLHPQEDDFWKPRSMKYKYDKIKVPVYFKCGWAPRGRWSAPVMNAMNSPELSVYKRCGVMEGYNGMELPYRFMNEEMLRWYDYWMKGIDTGITEEPPMKLNIIGRGYRYEHEWPLARTDWKKLYLHTFGQLRWEPVVEGNLEPDSFTHRPPQITTEVESLTYRTDRLGQPTEFTGPIELHLFAKIDRPDVNIIVKLWQITAGGTRMPVCRSGSLKTSYALDTEKSLIGRPVHDYSHKVEENIDEIREFVIEINPIGMVFPAGSAIELEIKASDPFEAQKGAWQGKMDHLGPIPSWNTVNYKIYRDKDYPSYILMPYIPSTPSELWLQPMVDDSIIIGGSGKGVTH